MQFRWSRAKAIVGIQPLLGLFVAVMWLTILLVVPGKWASAGWMRLHRIGGIDRCYVARNTCVCYVRFISASFFCFLLSLCCIGCEHSPSFLCPSRSFLCRLAVGNLAGNDIHSRVGG